LIKHSYTPDPASDSADDDSLFEHFTLLCTGNQTPLRIDKYLANQLPKTSRSRIKNAAGLGSVTVNGQPVKLSYKVKPHDKIKLLLPYPPPPTLEPEEMELDIRYEDEHVMVIHKPPGMVVHPGVGNHTGTLVHGLLWHVNRDLPTTGRPEDMVRPGLVHRLDKDTTGIMVTAKNERAHAHLSQQFFDRTTDRKYRAIVWGDVAEDEGTIVGHVGRQGKDRRYFTTYPDGSQGKHAVTHYRVIERFQVVTLVECKLETGRTHQIRVHMKHIGHTLFADHVYGGDQILKGPSSRKYQQMMRNCLEILPRQGLHAKSLAFTHPATGERMEFESELPDDMTAMLEKMRRWVAGTLADLG